jgi:hypothetical protein
MADSKISALPASTVPLAGTEVLPIVQSSATKQVTVANLTAGRAISATQLTLTTGNVIVASGQGIDFSATSGAPGATSELLADYEEGTWTPTVGGTSTYAIQKASYTKVGRLVTVNFDMQIILLGTGSTVGISGLPFTVGTGTSPKFEQGNGASGYFESLATTVYSLTFNAAVNGTEIYSTSTSATLGSTTANVNPAIYGNGTRVQGTVTYMATA